MDAGLIVKSVGGLYELMTADGERLVFRARGAFRHAGMKLLVGDRVTYTVEPDGSCAVQEILPRRNALIRPPLANTDILFCVIAAAHPAPDPVLTDKLLSIAEFCGIEPVPVVTKADQNPAEAEHIAGIYEKSGFTVFRTSARMGEGVDAVTDYIRTACAGRICAVAGVSGAGKTTLLNALFPSLSLETGELSRRIARGRNTTRQVELFPLCDLIAGGDGYIADTPGFSLLDFTRFDFYKKEDLPFTFRDFAPYLGKCRYTKCTHTKEEGCAILDAVTRGLLPASRQQSYRAIYDDLKNKHDWDS